MDQEEIKEWDFKKKDMDEHELIQMEKEIIHLQRSEGWGYALMESNLQLDSLEAKKKKLLLEQEEVWRLKSHEICLESRDENKKLFQAFTKGRKSQNTIWSL